MPGLIGCLANTGTKKEVLEARTKLRYSKAYQNDAIFQDENLIATRTHLNIIGEKSSPREKDGIRVWVEGEFYNMDNIKTRFELNANSEGAILLEAYLKDKLNVVLNKLDGYYSAIIYDSQLAEISFISDRYGIKPLYIFENGNKLAWSSELKGFQAFNSFSLTINNLSTQHFLKLGHFIADETLFAEVKQLGASKILRYSIRENRFIRHERYWNWAEIESSNLSFTEASVRLVELLKQAVQRQSLPSNVGYGLSLSGGFDSRAILACIDKSLPVTNFTFGQLDSDDVRIASAISKYCQVRHEVFEINEKNWLTGRVEGIWNSDGSINFIHLHATQFHIAMAKFCKVSFNGFAGDLIAGGSWIQNLNQRMSQQAWKKMLPYDFPGYYSDCFFDINKEDPFFIDFRVRRFTAYGLTEIKHFENRKPFMDNALIEFIYSLPDEYRSKSKLYKKALLDYFFEFFGEIPRQGTLFPIANRSKWQEYFVKVLHFFASKSGLFFKNYANYKKWILKDLSLFKTILNSPSSISKSILKDEMEQLTRFTTLVDTEVLGNLITLEIWLQQYFNKRMIKTEELENLRNARN